MLKIAVLFVTLAVASASIQADWVIYKAKYNKTYSEDEDSLRRYIYQSNMKKVQEHNELYAQGKSSYYLGENQFADWTNEEFVRKMNGMKINRIPGGFLGQYEEVSDLPKSVDWRKKGHVTGIKDQGQCGSCWAFSATGSLEGQHFAKTKKLVSLSESNLVDCSGKFGNQGCDGGLMDYAFDYIKANKGIDTEESYPYKPEDRPCKFKAADVGATVTGYVDVKSGSEKDLQKAIAKVGPVSVAIDASNMSFQMYSGGVYDEPECSSQELDHGVLAVGYGADSGKDYYIVKNSWGTSWGMKGYIWMSRNKDNQCGIATAASYPTV